MKVSVLLQCKDGWQKIQKIRLSDNRQLFPDAIQVAFYPELPPIILSDEAAAYDSTYMTYQTRTFRDAHRELYGLRVYTYAG